MLNPVEAMWCLRCREGPVRAANHLAPYAALRCSRDLRPGQRPPELQPLRADPVNLGRFTQDIRAPPAGPAREPGLGR